MEAINLEHEEWRAIPDAPGYEVSDLGRVRKMRGGRGNQPFLVSASPTGGGKLYVQIAPSGEQKRNMPVHSLVAHAFLGECPAGCVPAHLDGDLANNRLSNIGYLSPAEARERIGKFRAKSLPAIVSSTSYKPHKQRKLSDAQRAQLDALYELLKDDQPHSYDELVWAVGIHPESIKDLYNTYIIPLLNLAETGGLILWEEGGCVGLTMDRRAEYQHKTEPTPIRAPKIIAVEDVQEEQEETIPVEPIAQELIEEPVEQPVPDPEPEQDVEAQPAKSPLESWTATHYTRAVAGGLVTLEITQNDYGRWNYAVIAAGESLGGMTDTPEHAARLALETAREWLRKAADELA